jgi:hypothetical protein
MIENISAWMDDSWKEAEELLFAKRNLIIGLTYMIVLKNSLGAVSVHASAVKLKK